MDISYLKQMCINRLPLGDDTLNIIKSYIFNNPVRRVGNINTLEYIEYKNPRKLKICLRKLLTPLTSKNAPSKRDIGTSRWKRTDKIIQVPTKLNLYIMYNYTKIIHIK